MTEHQQTGQTLQAEIEALEQHLTQRERSALRLQRELGMVTQQGAQASALRGELQQTEEAVDTLRQRLASLQAQAGPPVAHPPQHEPLTGGQGIAIGSVAWIAQSGGVSTYLRTHPHFEMGEDVTRLTPGVQLTVLDGPEHEEAYTWWRVRTTDGREEWVPDAGLMSHTTV